MGALVAVGIGGACSAVQELSRSYAGAREAASCQAASGSFGAVNIREVWPWDTTAVCQGGGELSCLLGMLSLSSGEDILKGVGQYLEHISLGSETPQQRQLALMELAWGLYRFSAGSRTAVWDFSGDVRALYGRLLELEPAALEKWLVGVSLGLRDNLIGDQSRRTRSFVLKAKEYVRGRYGEEGVSLEAVSEELGVSKSFLSAIFKGETGISFMEYLTDYRMDQAARLLVETNEKSHMIARDVGYPDPNFFSYVFKSRFGMPPSRYRAERGERGKGGAL